MTNLIHITLEYSNAVLIVLLPHFTEFANKIELPIPLPITTNHVQRFVPRRFPGDVGGHIILTNGYRFWYSFGHVDAFESPRDYYAVQNPERIPEFVGALNMDKKGAIQLAREVFKKTGYDASFIDKKPLEVRGPEKWQGEIIPHYKLLWRSGKPQIIIDIDGENSKVTHIFVAGTNFWRDPPKIDIIPELESEYQKRVSEGKQIPRREPPPEKPKNDKK